MGIICFSYMFQLLATYLTFCGIAIYNAQLFDAYSKEYERNKVWLHGFYTGKKLEWCVIVVINLNLAQN